MTISFLSILIGILIAISMGLGYSVKKANERIKELERLSIEHQHNIIKLHSQLSNLTSSFNDLVKFTVDNWKDDTNTNWVKEEYKA
jgi:uncharacterized coiled-coil protein SlyX